MDAAAVAHQASYRSAHQQGQDGGNRGRRSGGRQIRKKTKARTPNNNTISIAAELDIPPNQRRLIVGRGAATLKWMKLVTGANIFVPHVQLQNRRGRRSNNNNQATDNSDDSSTLPQQQADQHPVRVNSSDLSSDFSSMKSFPFSGGGLGILLFVFILTMHGMTVVSMSFDLDKRFEIS